MPSTAPAPIKTNHGPSKSLFSPLPSELPRTPINGHFELLKSHEECLKTPITPPAAYTEFLKNTAASPAIQSPGLPPHHGSRTHSSVHGYYTPVTPYPPNSAARLLRIPQSPALSNYSPSTESPKSAASTRSPSDEDVAGEVRSGSQSGQRQITVKQVVTRTVTLTPRMSLMPAPKGKRRRIE
ncbi:hypothetical protein RUND412_009902 [Rhizina undulata]